MKDYHYQHVTLRGVQRVTCEITTRLSAKQWFRRSSTLSSFNETSSDDH